MRLFKRLDDFGDSKLTLKRNQGRDAFWFRLSKSADHSFIWFLLGLINMRRPKTSSFPSGHATAGICAAILLGINEPFLYLGLIPLGIMVGYSRMYTRMHHLSDILAGFILGLAYGLLAINVIY